MSLATFFARVSRAVRRGTVYDADIPTYVSDAVLTLEGLHNWRHMWKESFQQTLTAADSQITFVGRVKGVRYLRFVVPLTVSSPLAGRFAYSKKSQPESVTSGITFNSIQGTRFWMKSASVLQLNGAFAQNVLYDLGWYQYSVFDDNLPWLTLAPHLLLNQALMELLPLHRDEKVFARAQTNRDAILASLQESDLIHQFDSDDSEMVPYFDDFEEDLFSLNEGGF